MDNITSKIEIENELQEKLKENIHSVADFKKEIEESLKADVSVIIKTIMSSSILLNCSDLHIEAIPEGSTLRARIDGICKKFLILTP